MLNETVAANITAQAVSYVPQSQFVSSVAEFSKPLVDQLNILLAKIPFPPTIAIFVFSLVVVFLVSRLQISKIMFILIGAVLLFLTLKLMGIGG